METRYDVIIVGGGPGGIYSAYELKKLAPEKKVAVFEKGDHEQYVKEIFPNLNLKCYGRVTEDEAEMMGLDTY